MMPCSSRVASPGERASSNAFHQRALTSWWWRSGSLPVTFLQRVDGAALLQRLGPELPRRPSRSRVPRQRSRAPAPAGRGRSCPGRRRASCHSSHGFPEPTRGGPCGPPASRPSTPGRPPPACRRGAASDRSHPRSSTRCRAAQGAAGTTGGIAPGCPRRSWKPSPWTRSAPRRLPPKQPPHPASRDPEGSC